MEIEWTLFAGAVLNFAILVGIVGVGVWVIHRIVKK